MSELKNCPFCGGAPEVLQRPDALNGYFCAISCFCGGYSARAHQAATSDTKQDAYEKAKQRWNRRPAEPNEPLTLEQLREMDGEPVWIQGDSAKVSGWTLFKSSTEKQIARCPDEWNISYYLKDYGKTWLAYRRKTESEETE